MLQHTSSEVNGYNCYKHLKITQKKRETGEKIKLVRQSQIVQSVMYSYDAVISSYITPAIHSWDFDDET